MFVITRVGFHRLPISNEAPEDLGRFERFVPHDGGRFVRRWGRRFVGDSGVSLRRFRDFGLDGFHGWRGVA